MDGPADPAAPPSSDFVTFGHYRVARRPDGGLDELGRGAMGVTYRAYDPSLRIPVALKVIAASHVHDERARRRFRREASAAAQLDHPNVASVKHLGEEGGEFFYAMAYVAGRPLSALLKEEGKLSLPVALALAAQVAAALAAAHRRELIHRDLKPSNLMLLEGDAVEHDDERTAAAGNRQVKVIDFGLARSFGESRAEDSLATHASSLAGFTGTPAYASPEQCEGVADLDGRSDLYSLGVILWQCATGHLPFTGAPVQVIARHLYQAPPREQLAALPEPVVSLLAGLLEKAPAKRRPQTATELRGVLDEIRRALPVAPPSPETPVAEPPHPDSIADADTLRGPLPGPINGRWRLVGGLAAALGAIALIVWLKPSPDPAPRPSDATPTPTVAQAPGAKPTPAPPAAAPAPAASPAAASVPARLTSAELGRLAARSLASALAAAASIPDASTRVGALCYLAREQVARRDLPAARATLGQARAAVRAMSDDSASAASSLRDIAIAYATIGEVKEAQEAVAAMRFPTTYMAAVARGGMVAALVRRRATDDVAAVLAQGEAAAMSVADPAKRATALTEFALIQAVAGDPAKTRAAFERARRAAAALPADVREIYLRPVAEALARTGDLEGARAVALSLKKGAYPRDSALADIARAEAKKRDFGAARRTIDSIGSATSGSIARAGLAGELARAGHLLAAQAELSAIVDPQSRLAALADIAEAQAKAGDIKAALSTASTIQDAAWKQSAYETIAVAQARAGDIRGARETAGFLRDGTRKASVIGAITEDQAWAGDHDVAEELAGGMSDPIERFTAFATLAHIAAAQSEGRSKAEIEAENEPN